MEDKVTLYIATHTITGMKYFGKTTKWFTEDDLQKNYKGSGKYWSRHKKKHGDNEVAMEIYKICSLTESDEDYVRPIALKFSEENDIVKSKEWANLKPETGFDGGVTLESIEKMKETIKKTGGRAGSKNPNYGKTTPQETRDKISYTLKNNGYTDSEETRLKKSISGKNRPPVTEETREKISKINKGKQVSSETKEKMLATKRSREYGPNYNSLNVDIKNEHGEVIFSCLNNFCKICEENNLPGTALRNSIKTKKPIYINLDNGNLAKITNKGWIKYKGWIAELREISDE